MPPRTRPGSAELGETLRRRRDDLGLTIEEVARTAGVGSETWRRYEAGGSIRQDKARGVARALRWHSLPATAPSADDRPDDESKGGPGQTLEDFSIEDFDDSYSEWLAESFGAACARTFALGCDVIRDQMRDDLSELTSHPRGTHLGELGMSWLADWLPARWATRYDYEFLFRLQCTVDDLRLRATRPGWDEVPYFTRSVADDLALHLILQLGAASAEEGAEDWVEWERYLNGKDDEVIPVLYSRTIWIDDSSRFHFDHWFDVVHYGLGEERTGPDAEPESDS